MTMTMTMMIIMVISDHTYNITTYYMMMVMMFMLDVECIVFSSDSNFAYLSTLVGAEA